MQQRREKGLDVCRRAEASGEMLAAAERYEDRFEIRFETLTLLTQSLLGELHAPADTGFGLPADLADLLVASRCEASILARMEVLSEIANSVPRCPEQRQLYRSTLMEIYRALPRNPGWALGDPSVLFLAPEREGRILAEALGWLPEGHGLHPHAKRIPFEGGLLIGLSKLEIDRSCSKAVLIDGAIASGGTLMALMESLPAAISEIHAYSVHSTPEGARGLLRYGEMTGRDIRLTVGHCSGVLNDKHYAVEPQHAGRLVVGDLGDIITGIEGVHL